MRFKRGVLVIMHMCKMCGTRITPLMGECYRRGLCQNCYAIKQMEYALAKNGVLPIDLI